MYDLILETFDFIATRYACFGNGSKIAELSLLEFLIKDYQNFLFDYLQEINRDLYYFLLPILKELLEYVEVSVISGVSFVDTFNLKYHVNVLKELYTAFEKSNFSDKFDFNYYIYTNTIFSDRSSILNGTNKLLIKTMKEIANKIVEDLEHPITAFEYLKRSVYLSHFEIYLDDDAERVLELAIDIDEIQEVELMLEESEIFTHKDT